MSIEETPKVRYYEADSNPTLNGEGAQIPIFIGYSGNASPKPGIQKFKNFKALNKDVAYDGIGTTPETNPLLKTLKEFFQEARKVTSDDITVPYVYVIDLGAVPTTTAGEGDNAVTSRSIQTDPWLQAMDLAKSKRDVQVEVYVGLSKDDPIATVVGLIDSACSCIVEDSQIGNPRIAYITFEGATDENLKLYTDDTQENDIQKSRVGIIEPSEFGKTVANICCTPYYEEVGYSDFRSIQSGTYNKRTPEEMDELQSAGIIFIADELAGSEIHTRINLGVSTAFATNSDSRPEDALLHARRNVDQLIREVYAVLYKQLKRNETEINLSYLQTDVDVVVENKISAGYMMPGTELKVTESGTNPYDLKVEGVAVPVNATLIIGFSLFIESPNTTIGR
ncbi:MAG: hypothetical protein Q4P18_07235 [Methanobrevibacter sp.]|uniref:hypothetical protein n=1 Tax=Methanobrevibacter sp. TaxID=66852 RepID=UPI0026DEEFE2|nr:hypothetical protein [Methanobrevibacter sp.]MDO5849311.1 hypothetical protein [Methanobrevibacter sp.]